MLFMLLTLFELNLLDIRVPTYIIYVVEMINFHTLLIGLYYRFKDYLSTFLGSNIVMYLNIIILKV